MPPIDPEQQARIDGCPCGHNARECLEWIANWLGWTNEDVSFGLKSPEDAVKLWRYWLAHQDDLDEFPDSWSSQRRIAALGYDPLRTSSSPRLKSTIWPRWSRRSATA